MPQVSLSLALIVNQELPPEAAAVFAATHELTIRPVQQAAADEETDEALADRRLKSRHGFRGEAQLLESQGFGVLSAKHAVDHDDMEVPMGIEQGAEAVDEDDGAEARAAVRRDKTLSQALFDAPQKAVQHGVKHGRASGAVYGV
jgi:hypothetical protein